MTQLICHDHVRHVDGAIVRLSDPENDYHLFQAIADVLDSPTLNQPKILDIDHKSLSFMWCQLVDGHPEVHCYSEFQPPVLTYVGSLYGIWRHVVWSNEPSVSKLPDFSCGHGSISHKQGQTTVAIGDSRRVFADPNEPLYAHSFHYDGAVRIGVVYEDCIRVYFMRDGRLKAMSRVELDATPVAFHGGYVMYSDGTIWRFTRGKAKCALRPPRKRPVFGL